MKPTSSGERRFGVRMRIGLGAAILLLVGFWFMLPSREESIRIIGSLPAADIEEIKQLVREESPLLPDLSWESIKNLPNALRWRGYPIRQIAVGTNGTVSVETGVIERGLGESGRIYEVKKGTNGWQVLSGSFWWSYE